MSLLYLNLITPPAHPGGFFVAPVEPKTET
jgi:hypothetical protein